MKTPKLHQTSQIQLKGFETLVRKFFRRIAIEVYRKSVMENLCSHLHVGGRICEKSLRTKFCENSGLCASRHSAETLAKRRCTLSKF